jgi:hypothetical protein
VIRSLPLVPPPDPTPSIRRVLDALSNNGIGPDRCPEYDMLFNQALWLLDSVYEVEEIENVRFIDKMFGATTSERDKAAAAISRLKLGWDVKKQDYTFADGTVPRIDRPGSYRRNIWKPDIPELNLTMIIERINRKVVEARVSWSEGEQELRNHSGVISIHNASNLSLPVAQIKLEYLESGSTSTGATIKFEEGQILVVVFEGARTTSQSPEYKP